MLNIHEAMTELAKTRPIFHSEADFQHALVSHIKKLMPDSQVQMNFNPFPYGRRMSLDVWIYNLGTAIELKYKTKRLEVRYNHELFTLKEQSAQDFGRYDFLKDVARIESAVQASEAKRGFAVLLTNDQSYWNKASWRKRNSNDAAFRIHDGKDVSGKLTWLNTDLQSSKSRPESINLSGSYNLRWRDYSEAPGTGGYRQFRYLAVGVGE